MSRWRETLCGSVMKAAFIEAESRKCLLKGGNDTLSCGGSFLPTRFTLKKVKKEKSPTVFLPRESYGVIHETDGTWNRYDEKITSNNMNEIDEDAMDIAMNYLDTKISKY